VTVARDIDFHLTPGAMHCLIGPNGAGKSSFFRMILGEHAPDSGQILFRARTSPPCARSSASAAA
jgi:ABC-type sugar transport system ATPase subunit